jgi:hypothetical protein
MFVGEFNPEHRAGQHGGDGTFHFNVLFFHDDKLAMGTKSKKTGSGSPEPRRENLAVD